VTESWAPIGSGRDLLRDPVIGTIALEHGKAPAQVVLRWDVPRHGAGALDSESFA
jgi:2,5-diketo-D-gluconate reductase A